MTEFLFEQACLGGGRARVEKNPEVLEDRVGEKRFPAANGDGCTSIYLFIPYLGANGTPLHTAAGRGAEEVLSFLLDEGLDVNLAASYDESSPLHLASFNGELRCMEILLDRGADMEQKSGEMHQGTPLSWAIVAGNAISR